MDPTQQPAQPYPGATAPPVQPKPDAKLTLTTTSEESRTALTSCLDALDHFRTELVRQRCADALDKDDKLTMAHALRAWLFLVGTDADAVPLTTC